MDEKKEIFDELEAKKNDLQKALSTIDDMIGSKKLMEASMDSLHLKVEKLKKKLCDEKEKSSMIYAELQSMKVEFLID